MLIGISIILVGISIVFFLQSNKIANKLVFLTAHLPNALPKEEATKRLYQLDKINKLISYVKTSEDEVIISNAKNALRFEILSYLVFLLAVLFALLGIYLA